MHSKTAVLEPKVNGKHIIVGLGHGHVGSEGASFKEKHAIAHAYLGVIRTRSADVIKSVLAAMAKICAEARGQFSVFFEVAIATAGTKLACRWHPYQVSTL